MARRVYTVREGKHLGCDGPVLATGYRSDHPAREPAIGDILYLEGSGPWRVVDYMKSDPSGDNLLIVERVE